MMPKDFQIQKAGQCYERKSIRMEPKALAVPLVAFANADGGTIVVGINDAGKVEGVDGLDRQVNELLRVPFDFCKPTVKVDKGGHWEVVGASKKET